MPEDRPVVAKLAQDELISLTDVVDQLTKLTQAGEHAQAALRVLAEAARRA